MIQLNKREAIMRDFIDMTPEEKAAYDVANKIRRYGLETKQRTYGFASHFYIMTSEQRNGELVEVIKFKKHSFRNLLGESAPDDIVSRKSDKLLIAFQVGLSGGQPKWNVPAY